MKKALITGITGQDGSYLAELLLGKGYEVHGLIRRSSTFNTARIDHMYVDPHTPDAKTVPSLRRSQRRGAFGHSSRTDTPGRGSTTSQRRSHVRVSFDEPEHTGDTTGIGSIRLLEAVRMAGLECRFYQASSSRDVRCDTASAGRADSLLSAIAVRCGEGVLVLDHQELPRGVRDLCRERNSVQPRISAARAKHS